MTLFCGTWNVNGRVLDEGTGDDLRSWLVPPDQFISDIYAVGFQVIAAKN